MNQEYLNGDRGCALKQGNVCHIKLVSQLHHQVSGYSSRAARNDFELRTESEVVISHARKVVSARCFKLMVCNSGKILRNKNVTLSRQVKRGLSNMVELITVNENKE